MNPTSLSLELHQGSQSTHDFAIRNSINFQRDSGVYRTESEVHQDTITFAVWQIEPQVCSVATKRTAAGSCQRSGRSEIHCKHNSVGFAVSHSRGNQRSKNQTDRANTVLLYSHSAAVAFCPAWSGFLKNSATQPKHSRGKHTHSERGKITAALQQSCKHKLSCSTSHQHRAAQAQHTPH